MTAEKICFAVSCNNCNKYHVSSNAGHLDALTGNWRNRLIVGVIAPEVFLCDQRPLRGRNFSRI